MNTVVLSNVRPRLRELCSLLETIDGGIAVTPIEGGLDRLASIPARQELQVLIFDCGAGQSADFDKIEHLRQVYPEMACIIVADEAVPELLLRAMRAGVREVLPHPVTEAALSAAMGRVVKKTNGHERRHGRILTFVACKGGGGTTFIAANLAYVLSQREQHVLLLDLNLQFGDAALFVSDQKPTTTVADVAEEIDRVDASFITSCVVNVTPNLSILAAPEDPGRARVVRPEHVDTMLRLVRHQYDFIVIDAGRGLDAVSIRALDHADTIYPVLQLTLPFIRDGKRLVDAFRSLDYGRDKIRVVVNRYQKGGDIGLDDIQRALGHAVAHVVPNQFDEVAASVNQGVPILKLAPNSHVSKALLEMADTFTVQPSKNAGGLFARLLHRS